MAVAGFLNHWKVLVFILSSGIVLGNAKLDADMFGPQGSELLKELKESGVIDQFEQELEKMLKEKDLKPPAKEVEEEETEDDPIKDFINSYVEEKSIVLDPRYCRRIA